MFKNLTLLAVAGLLTNTGCIITTPTDTDSGTNVTAPTTEDTTTTEGTTDTTDGTAGTTALTTTLTTTAPTTTEAPTTGTTEGTTEGTTAGTTEGTTAETTTGALGTCGWNADQKYYECGQEGEDPDGISPIDCPEELPAEGDKCDENAPVNNVGCCAPGGMNYYCSNENVVVIAQCD